MKHLTTAHVLTVNGEVNSSRVTRYFENEPDFRPMHTKLERLLSKSLTTLEVMTYYLVVHTGPGGRKTYHRAREAVLR